VIREVLADSLRAALEAHGVAPPDVIGVERPRVPEHGDWSSNVALVVGKKAGRNPRQLATDVAAWLTDPAHRPQHVELVEVAGGGFVNFRLRNSWLHDVLRTVIDAGIDGYARHDLGGGRRVNVEFVSANPTGPVHAGGGRWAAYGDALCNLLERCGHEVHREYYLNDRGTQMKLFADSLAARARGEEPPEDGYQGEYIRQWAAEMPDGADPWAWGYARVRRDIEETLARIGVHYDTWFSEQTLVESGAIDATLADLRAHGHVFDADGAVWLRTTDFDDDKDRVLVRSDGEPTYLLPDVAYHRDKFSRGWQLLIDVWGADHHGYVSRLKTGVAALGHDRDELEIILGQLVTLVRGGEPVRMSKRTGNLVSLEEVLDEVGSDAARLTFLLQSLDTKQTFDIDLVTSRSMDNPVHYVQYAHARIASIGRQAAERGVTRQPVDTVDIGLLDHDKELDLLRSLSELPAVVLDACVTRGPHKVTTWVRDLAGRFHSFYQDDDCYVLSDRVPAARTQARLWLVEATRIGLAVGLGLLGVSAPESM
jgi:arginyl-tRNA synthetase